ncbi:heme A synthase Cox15p [Trichomonascus vanleenenianus]|uniref:Cox15p n=1 Tax=Trichomonascus vanleenenianus TaxID=2268995 RepID=UPI003EC9AF5A
MPLARSQFFFLRNLSISSAAASCGSTRLAIPSLKTGARIMTSSILSRVQLKAAKPQLPKAGGSARSFSTSARRPAEMSAEMREAAKAFTEAAQTQKAQTGSSRRARPINSSKYVGYWLVGSAGLVFGITVLGGLTRLTESGLSITEWKPVTGSIPPLSHEDWLNEFELYKQSPEFKILNANITLEEYKFIYYMEWAHRLWGRFIGLAVVIPAAYFIMARRTSAHTTGRLVLISGLLGLQGFIGWWMVKSGLNQDFLEQAGAHPRVSHYRLATHLGCAFVLFSTMIATGVQVLREARWVKNPVAALQEYQVLSNPALKPFRRITNGLVVLVFLTAMSGAFVAGLDAGMIYNSFPYMGDSIIPPKSELFSSLYSSAPVSQLKFYIDNVLDNPTTVQLVHRIMACTTFAAIFGMHMYSLKLRPILPRHIFKTGAHSMGLVTLQAALGISTLIYVVPTHLAATHQATAMALLAWVLLLSVKMRLPRSTVRHLVQVLAKNAATKAPK